MADLWHDLIKRGLLANLPTAPTVPGGCFYYATDTQDLFFWTGTAWIIVVNGP